MEAKTFETLFQLRFAVKYLTIKRLIFFPFMSVFSCKYIFEMEMENKMIFYM